MDDLPAPIMPTMTTVRPANSRETLVSIGSLTSLADPVLATGASSREKVCAWRRVEPLSALPVKDEPFGGLGPAIFLNSNGTFGKSCDDYRPMPSLFRFLFVVAVLAVLGGAAVVYLANFVGPNTRDMTIRIPPSRLEPKP